jgi:hypothetical protein
LPPNFNFWAAVKAWATLREVAKTVAVTAGLQRPLAKLRLRHSVKRQLPRQPGAALMTWMTTFRFDLRRLVWPLAITE